MTAKVTRRHGEARRRLRRRLEAQGVAPAVIERRVDALRRRQEAARRAGVTRLRDLDQVHNETWAERRLDDTGYQPALGDPLQRGAARVNDITARAARRRNAMTKHEYDLQETTP